MLLISNVVASNYAQFSRSQCHSDYFEIFYLIIQLLKIGFYHFNQYFGTDTDLSFKTSFTDPSKCTFIFVQHPFEYNTEA